MVFSAGWTIQEISLPACHLLSSTRDELLGRSFLEFVAEAGNWFAALSTGEIENGETPLTRDVVVQDRHGRKFWCRAVVRLAARTDGPPTPLGMALTNIDDLKRPRSQFISDAQLLDRVLAVVDDVFWVEHYASEQTLYVSPAFEKIWGLRTDELRLNLRLWFESIHPQDRPRVNREREMCRAKALPCSYEYRIRRPDGSERWVWDKSFPVYDVDGNVDIYIGSARDITERKLDEAVLARLHAAENIGSIAADLAHNFNNLLSIIDMSAHAIERMTTAEPATKKLASIHSAVGRGVEITKSLLAISSRQMLVPEHIDANAAIRDLMPLISASVGPNISVSFTLTDLPCPMLIDRSGLNQAIVNLVTNAREAMPEGGEMRVETRLILAESDHSCCEAGTQCIVICVQDSGPGMSDHALRHATDPYYSTKKNGGGFGLAITHGFAMQSGGRLRLANRPTGGLSVELILPRQGTRQGEAVEGVEDTENSVGTGHKVLIVDDESDIIELLGELLDAEGYVVTCVSTTEAAKQCIDREQYSLMLCDVALGGKTSGIDLATWVKDNAPATKIALMSGYTSEQMKIPKEFLFIAKPFESDRILNVIHEQLSI